MKRRLFLALLWPLLVLACLYTLVRYWFAVAQNPDKAASMAFMLDEAANVALNGKENTTISGRAARARQAGRRWGCLLCKLLDRVDPGHCADNIEN